MDLSAAIKSAMTTNAPILEGKEPVVAPVIETPKEGEAPKDGKTEPIVETPAAGAETLLEELTDEEVVKAKDLYKVLKKDSPDRDAVISFIAEKAGYTKGDISTPKEAKVATKEIIDVFKEKLGTDYPHLVDQLVPAIKEYVDAQLEKATKPIKEDLAENQLKDIKTRVSNAFEAMGKEFYDTGVIPADVDTLMSTLMNTYEISSKQTVDSYLEDIFKLATAKLGKIPLSSEARKRAKSARNNAPSSLDSKTGRPQNDETIIKPGENNTGKPITLHEAVTQAVKLANKELSGE